MGIVVDDLSDINQTLMRGWYAGMQLTTAEGSTLELSAGSSEEIAGALLFVQGSDETITTAGVSDGKAWVYVGADTATTGETYLSNTPPTFYPDKRGFYDGSYKAIYSVQKEGSEYKDRIRLQGWQPYGIETEGSVTIGTKLQHTGLTAGDRTIGQDIVQDFTLAKVYSTNASETVFQRIYLTEDLAFSGTVSIQFRAVSYNEDTGSGKPASTLEIRKNGVAVHSINIASVPVAVSTVVGVSPSIVTSDVSFDSSVSIGDEISVYCKYDSAASGSSGYVGIGYAQTGFITYIEYPKIEYSASKPYSPIVPTEFTFYKYT